MYAVIKTGGKQYRVTQGDVIKVEKLNVDEGATVELGDVIMVADGDDIKVGMPFVKGSIVKAEIVSHGRHGKIEIIKFKRRKHHDKQMGHRQYYTEIEIKEITGEGGAKLKTAPEPRPESKAAKAAAKPVAKSSDEESAPKKVAAKKATAKKASTKKTATKKATAKKTAAKKTTTKKASAKKSTAKKKKT